MNEEFEYASPEEEALLEIIREYKEKLPKIQMWVAHPTNYPQALKSVEQIIELLKREDDEIEYNVSFDDMFGTSMCLQVKGWTFSFGKAKEFAEIISLADTFDILATTEGETLLFFGFKHTRIPVFLKEKDGELL